MQYTQIDQYRSAQRFSSGAGSEARNDWNKSSHARYRGHHGLQVAGTDIEPEVSYLLAPVAVNGCTRVSIRLDFVVGGSISMRGTERVPIRGWAADDWRSPA
jgi:hypothetical protein